MAKAWKVKISGSYRTAKREIVDYQGVDGIIPFCAEDVAFMNIRARYASMWIGKDPKYTERLYSIREVYLDEIEEIEAEFSYVGKGIKSLTFEEMQDLATAKELRRIPLFKATSLREAQIIAYTEYSTKVLLEPLDSKTPDFNYAKLPDIKIDGDVRVDKTVKLTNEDIIRQEQSNSTMSKPTLTLAELKQIAKNKEIKYHPNIGYDTLYGKIFA